MCTAAVSYGSASASSQRAISVVSTTQGAVDPDAFIVALATALDGIGPENIEITSFEMRIDASATVDWECSAQDAAEQQFVEGVKRATGVQTVTINDATSDFGCRRRHRFGGRG